MGVSVFPGRENLIPNVERVARDACSRLAQATRESIHERLRDVLSRLVDELVLEGGLFFVPFEPQVANVAIGSLAASNRAVAECLAGSRLQNSQDDPEVLVVADPPHQGRATALAADDHLHLWALGIRTLIVVPLYRQAFSRGALALYSQRAQPQLAGALAPLTAVADAVRTALESLRGSRNGDRTSASDSPDAAPRRGAPAPDEADPLGAAHDDTLVGESAAWRYVVFRLDQVAATTATVLLLGETGTGKELVARAIHRRSSRANGKFVALNCAALPATLVESELFGRERGAFTGAHSSQVGRFEHAHRGTLFLDEVGDLPSELQPKLLRVLQEGQLERLGSARTVDVDVRVVAATNRDLAEEVRQNRFRDDLYYRLNVFPITLPSLRERREDIPLLAQHLANRFARAMHKPIKPISDTVARALQQYDWPGNVRELENVVHRAIILSSDGVISLSDIALSAVRVTASVGTTLEEIERNHIQRMLSTTLWRIEGRRGAAELLGMKPSTLRSRLRKLGIRRGA
jgi:transcriptional regulator with GAF, ATPase, and Fis domain